MYMYDDLKVQSYSLASERPRVLCELIMTLLSFLRLRTKLVSGRYLVTNIQLVKVEHG